MSFKGRKKALKLACMIISVFFTGMAMFDFSGPIFADQPDRSGYSQGPGPDGKLIADSGTGNQVILNEIKPTGTDKNFLPILVTSIVVMGILIFAMWQTFKSKRIY